MKTIVRAALVALLATSSVVASQSSGAAGVATYEPSRRKGLGGVFDFAVAKIERIFDRGQMSELISAFIDKCDAAFAIMLRSFKDMSLSYAELHDKEAGRLKRFDDEFRDVTKLRGAIDRRCLYASAGDERSLCVEKGMEVNAKVKALQASRARSAAASKHFEEMIAWCASYKNWFC